MKKIFSFLIVIIVISACSKNKNTDTEAIGTWKLVEQLMDPGDGSGIFVAVESEKTITFLKKGKIESNGALCSIDGQNETSSKGSYNVDDYTITIEDCFDGDQNSLTFNYEIVDSYLILTFQCIEGCQQKFVKED